jgi:hypothetical protein
MNTIEFAGSLNPRTIIANPLINPGERVMVDFKVKGRFHKIRITIDSERLNCAFTGQKSGWGYYFYKISYFMNGTIAHMETSFLPT